MGKYVHLIAVGLAIVTIAHLAWRELCLAFSEDPDAFASRLGALMAKPGQGAVSARVASFIAFAMWVYTGYCLAGLID